MNSKGGWQIYAYGDCCHEVLDTLPDLKPLLKESGGKPVRRVGRFIQIALVALRRCIKETLVPESASVYLSSCRGDLELTVDIMTQMQREGQAPRPLSFVNTVSNAACFYVAKELGLCSSSQFLCSRYLPFENALCLAHADLEIGKIESALVGSVDIATEPLGEHRVRLGLDEKEAVGEAAHWIWMGPANRSLPNLGELSNIGYLRSESEVIAWIQAQNTSNGDARLAFGPFVSEEVQASFSEALGIEALTTRRNVGYYDSRSGGIVSEFFRSDTKIRALFGICSDAGGNFCVMYVKRTLEG